MKKAGAALAALTLVIAGLAVACGGSDSSGGAAGATRSAAPISDQAYNDALSAAEQKVTTAEQAARNEASPQTPVSKITPLLESWAAAMDSAADDLSSITPPSKAASANDHLVTALHDFSTDLQSATDKIKSSSKPWLKTLTSIMSKAKGPQELDAAIKELNGLGYGSAAGG